MKNTRSLRVLNTALAGVLGTSMALGCAGLASAQDDPAPQGRSIVSEARTDSQVMNYAINLEGASADDVTKAIELAGAIDNTKVLATYPELGSFFAQSGDADFAKKLGDALTGAKIAFDSVGSTRFAPVTGDELVIEQPSTRTRRSVDQVVSQLDREAQLSDTLAEVDPMTEQAWGLYAIHAVEAAEQDRDWKPVTVGVLDTGVDGTHPDLKDQIDVDKSVGCDNNGIIDHSWDAWQPNHYHGTHVAGTIAASLDGEGIQGVAPHATLAAVRVANDNGSFYPEYVTCGFMWAAEAGMDVTNNSYYVDPWAYWLPEEPSQAAGLEVVSRAVSYAHDHGVLNVAAAGNSNQDLDDVVTDSESPNDVEGAAVENRPVEGGLDIPTMLPETVTVSATALPADTEATAAGTATLSRSGFSNYGSIVDVAAPGSRILSTFPVANDSYAAISGTSMASPHVAGVAALVKSVHPTYTPDQVRDVIKRSAQRSRLADDPAGKNYQGTGLVDALAAITYTEYNPTVSLSAPTFSAGQDMTVKLAGFEPGETISLSILPEGSESEVVADASGAVEKTFTLAQDSVIGDYTLEAKGLTSLASASAEFAIVEAAADDTVETPAPAEQSSVVEVSEDGVVKIAKASKLPATGQGLGNLIAIAGFISAIAAGGLVITRKH